MAEDWAAQIAHDVLAQSTAAALAQAEEAQRAAEEARRQAEAARTGGQR